MSSYRYVFLHIGLYRGPFSAQLFGFSFAELTQTLIFISQAFCFQGKEKPFSKVSRTRVWTKRRVGHVLLFGPLVVRFLKT